VSSVTPTLRAAGLSDVGAQRVVNEDRFFADAGRGIFMVIDGVGGQAAGGRAADTALAIICTQLASGSGTAADRVRDAIAAANNEVHRQASTRPEWKGMACVLTLAVVDGERAVIGHVGDTRPEVQVLPAHVRDAQGEYGGSRPIRRSAHPSGRGAGAASDPRRNRQAVGYRKSVDTAIRSDSNRDAGH